MCLNLWLSATKVNDLFRLVDGQFRKADVSSVNARNVSFLSLREFMNFISLLLITSLLFYLPVHVAQQWYINNLVPFSFGVFLIDTVSLPVCLFVSLWPRRNNKANFPEQENS